MYLSQVEVYRNKSKHYANILFHLYAILVISIDDAKVFIFFCSLQYRIFKNQFST